MRQPPPDPNRHARHDDLGAETRRIGGKMRQGRGVVPHRVVAELAERQHGVVATRQLLALGLGPDAIQRRITDRRYVPVFRGVLAVGHARLRIEGRWMAGVLAAGPDARLSHANALMLRGVLRVNGTQIHVTVPRLTGGAHRRAGLVVHRCKLDPRDLDVVDGIPTTTVARAMLDYAERARGDMLDRALDEAYKRDLFDLEAILEVLERARGRRGVRPLRRALEIYVPEKRRLNSWLEKHMLRLIREAGLPLPQVNVHVNGHEVDLEWPEHGLLVELDSSEHHNTPWAVENDKARDSDHVARGQSVMRFTHRRVTREPDVVIARLREALSRRGTRAA
jgi:very-short-patch-repair endonuclease